MSIKKGLLSSAATLADKKQNDGQTIDVIFEGKKVIVEGEKLAGARMEIHKAKDKMSWEFNFINGELEFLSNRERDEDGEYYFPLPHPDDQEDSHA